MRGGWTCADRLTLTLALTPTLALGPHPHPVASPSMPVGPVPEYDDGRRETNGDRRSFPFSRISPMSTASSHKLLLYGQCYS